MTLEKINNKDLIEEIRERLQNRNAKIHEINESTTSTQENSILVFQQKVNDFYEKLYQDIEPYKYRLTLEFKEVENLRNQSRKEVMSAMSSFSQIRSYSTQRHIIHI